MIVFFSLDFYFAMAIFSPVTSYQCKLCFRFQTLVDIGIMQYCESMRNNQNNYSMDINMFLIGNDLFINVILLSTLLFVILHTNTFLGLNSQAEKRNTIG
jgi:hypothetical protein